MGKLLSACSWFQTDKKLFLLQDQESENPSSWSQVQQIPVWFSFRIKPSIIPQIPMIELSQYPCHSNLFSVLSTAITVDLKSQYKQLLNTFKQFINIWNNPEQHHQKPRQAYQKCLFIPSTVV